MPPKQRTNPGAASAAPKKALSPQKLVTALAKRLRDRKIINDTESHQLILLPPKQAIMKVYAIVIMNVQIKLGQLKKSDQAKIMKLNPEQAVHYVVDNFYRSKIAHVARARKRITPVLAKGLSSPSLNPTDALNRLNDVMVISHFNVERAKLGLIPKVNVPIETEMQNVGYCNRTLMSYHLSKFLREPKPKTAYEIDQYFSNPQNVAKFKAYAVKQGLIGKIEAPLVKTYQSLRQAFGSTFLRKKLQLPA